MRVALSVHKRRWVYVCVCVLECMCVHLRRRESKKKKKKEVQRVYYLQSDISSSQPILQRLFIAQLCGCVIHFAARAMSLCSLHL